MNATLKSSASWVNFKTNTAYEFINNDSDERLNSNIENLHFYPNINSMKVLTSI